MLFTISFAEFKKFKTGSAFLPDMFIAIPNITENTNSAIKLSLVNSFEKSFTVNKLTVLSAIDNSSSSCTASSSNTSTIFAESLVFTSFIKYVLKKPTSTAITDVITNTNIIVPTILPKRLGSLILATDVVIVKNISGTITTNKRFKKISPNGASIVAFSLKISPMTAPTIIATRRIIVDL